MAAEQTQYEPAPTAEPMEQQEQQQQHSHRSKSISHTAGHLRLLRQNLLRTVSYCLLFSLVGMSDASLGAALPGLTCLARTSEQKATLLLFFHEAGVLLMTVFSGFLNRKLPANVVLAGVSMLVPASFVLVTLCRSLPSMVGIFTLMGCLEGCLEYFCNAQMIFLYRSGSGPFLQAMFFCQSLGAFASPLIIGSFMAGGDAASWSNCSLPEELEATVSKSLGRAAAAANPKLSDTLARVRHPFYTIAVLQIPIMLSMLFLCYKEGWTREVTRSGGAAGDGDNPEEEQAELREEGASAYLVLIVASLCALTLDGILGSYSSLIYTFSMRSVSSSADRIKTAYLSATFWGSTLVGRLVGVVLTLKMSTAHVIFMDLGGLLLAAILFMIGQHSISSLFAATVFTGFFISHCMPALLTLTEQFILVTRDRATSLVASAAFGEAVVPVVMAAVMHQVGRSAYPAFHSLFVLISGVLCFFLVNFGYRTRKSEFSDSGLSNFLLFGIFSKQQQQQIVEPETEQQLQQLQYQQQEEDLFANWPGNTQQQRHNPQA